MLKKFVLSGLILSVLLFVGCQQKAAEEESLFYYTQSAKEIADWASMVTPGGGEGSAELGDNVAIVKAAADGWGGVQSAPITLDLTKEPMLFVQIKESADGFQWGAKFVPSDPEIEDHEWGMYLIEDNGFKWNNYAVSDIGYKLDQSFIDVYGEKVEGVLWIFAAGGPEAVVEISQVKIMNQK